MPNALALETARLAVGEAILDLERFGYALSTYSCLRCDHAWRTIRRPSRCPTGCNVTPVCVAQAEDGQDIYTEPWIIEHRTMLILALRHYETTFPAFDLDAALAGDAPITIDTPPAPTLEADQARR